MKAVLVTAVFCWLMVPVAASAQAPKLTSRDLIRLLQTPLDMKYFQNPMTLKEFLGLLYEKVQTQVGVELPILVDQQAFKEANPKAGDIYESNVKFPPYPKEMSIGDALKLALSQVSIPGTTHRVRAGWVEVTTLERTSLRNLLQQRVVAAFERKPLEEIFHELAEQAGVSIQVDSRAKDKLVTPVNALFRNDTSVRDALVMLADMGGLQVVELPTAVYITTPANAEALNKVLCAKPSSGPK